MEPRRRSARNLEVPTEARRSARIKKLMVAPHLEVPMAAPHLEVGLAGPAFQDKKGRTRGRRPRRYPPLQGAVLPHQPQEDPPFQGANHQEAPLLAAPVPHHLPLLDLRGLELFGKPFRGSPLKLLFLEDEGEDLQGEDLLASKKSLPSGEVEVDSEQNEEGLEIGSSSFSTHPKIGSSSFSTQLLPIQEVTEGDKQLLPVQDVTEEEGVALSGEKIVDSEEKLIHKICEQHIIIESVNKVLKREMAAMDSLIGNLTEKAMEKITRAQWEILSKYGIHKPDM